MSHEATASSRSAPAGRRQTWTIAKIELRRAFFAKRSIWVYGLALLPSVIFFTHGLETKFRLERLGRHGAIAPALMDSVGDGESIDDVKKRLGKPVDEDLVVAASGASGSAPVMPERQPT